MIYFDNAATSWPKPPGMEESLCRNLRECGSPGRSGHEMSVRSSRHIFDLREEIAELFDTPDSSRVIFCKNITEAINTVLFGTLNPGDHVITTDTEHNSVIRPLRYLAENGIGLSLVSPGEKGIIEPADLERCLRPETRLVAIGHGCNVTGSVQPLDALADFCKSHKITFLVDAAQTAGSLPISLSDPIHGNTAFCFTGHKSLFGPSGTGGFILGSNLEIRPLIFGGTGSLSEKDIQPEFLPDSLESGTMNFLGLAGLLHGVEYIRKVGVSEIHNRGMMLRRRFIDAVRDIQGISLYAGETGETTAALSFNIDGLMPSRVGRILSENHDICCRIGLHCNPLIHKRLGTFPDGTVRFAFSHFNTEQEIDTGVSALRLIVSGVE